MYEQYLRVRRPPIPVTGSEKGTELRLRPFFAPVLPLSSLRCAAVRAVRYGRGAVVTAVR